MTVALDTLARWLQEGRDPPGGWRPGWKHMARQHMKGKKVVASPAKVRPVAKVVSDEVHTARLAACESCEHLRPESRACGLCGCGAPVDSLATRPWHRCPDGRWHRTLPLDQL